MKMKLFALFFVVFCTGIIAQNYDTVSIRDIQYISPDSLTNYFDFPLSQLNGDTVTVTGVVMESPYKDPSNPDSVIMYVGAASGFFMQDTAQGKYDWSGIFIFNPNDVPGTDFSNLDSGMVVTVTGIVLEYYNGSTQKTTEISVINFTAQNVVGQMIRPQPEVLTIDSLKNPDNTSKPISVKWEGAYVEFDSVTTLNRTSTGAFQIQDASGLILNVYNRSDYFFGSGWPAPLDGTILQYMRGYIETRSDGSGGGISLDPAYRSDMGPALLFPPSISNVLRDPAVVGYGQSVDVSANIIDQDGTVDSTRIIWRKNFGAYQVVNMTQSLSDTTLWTGTLPAQNDSSFIDYFIWAKDNDGHVALSPGDTARSRYTYFVLDHALTIQHVQYSPFGSGYSGYNGYQVTVSGVVTADSSDINGNETGTLSGPQVYIQNGQGPWSGIEISGTEVYQVHRGDAVTVTGNVDENYSVTEISGIDDPSNITITGTQQVPDPQVLATSTIDLLSSGTVQAEQWEGVLVKYQNLTVTDGNADGDPGPNGNGNYNYGDIMVADGSNSNTRVTLQYGNNSYQNGWAEGQDTLPHYVRQGDTFESLTGIMWYGFSYYKLIPRKDDDFTGWVADVKSDKKNQPVTYQLNQNYPNPFNPSTIISYSIPKAGLVTLKIYNILGQEVKTLINEYKNSGSYKVNFYAASLASGVYFYRLISGNFVQVKKMVLLK
jgi:Secretion system C-terminal sorting domain